MKAVVILNGRVPHAVLLELFTEHGAGTLRVALRRIWRALATRWVVFACAKVMLARTLVQSPRT